MPPRATIAIVTLNRAPYLRRVLTSLRYLDYTDFEVVVVNGPSEDDTDAVLEEYKDDIKIAACGVRNISAARNIAIQRSQGDVVAFIDDDCVPESPWLSRIVAGFDREDIAAVGGPVFGPTGLEFQYQCTTSSRQGNSVFLDAERSDLYNAPLASRYSTITGGNAAFRRRVLLELGGFDEEYDYCLDETDLCVRIVDSGYVIRYAHGAYVHHKHAPSVYYRNEQGGLFNRYPVIKNHVYFGIKFLPDFADDSLRDLITDSLAFVEENRKSMEYERKAGMFSDEEVGRFSASAERALVDGLRRGLGGDRRLLQYEKISRDSSPYKPFPTLCTPGERISLCIINTGFESPEADAGTVFDRELAYAAAALGHNVHVVTRGTNVSTMGFEDGIWIHRMAPTDRAEAAMPWLPGIPRNLWNQSSAMYKEVVRVSERQDIHIIQWPVNGLQGIAALMEQRFVNVLSLLSISKSVSWRYGEKDLLVTGRQSTEDARKTERFCLENAQYVLVENRSVVDSIRSRFGVNIPDPRICCAERGDAEILAETGGIERSVAHVIDFYRQIVRQRYRRAVRNGT